MIAGLNIPSSINGHIISTIFYDKKMEDAFFISEISRSQTTTNGTTATASGKSLIVGGRGKFVGANGELDYTLTFDTMNPNKAGFNMEG